MSLTQLCFFLVLVIAFGDANIEFKECVTTSTLSKVTGGRFCYDDMKFEKCLKNITTDDRLLSRFVESTIMQSQKRMDACPGFIGTKKCYYSESEECLKSFEDKTFRGDKSICKEIKGVLDCMVRKLNDTCTQDTIREAMSEVKKVESECKAGTFHGPCSERTIRNCMIKIDDDGCTNESTEEALSCLSSLKSKCLGDAQQDEIQAVKDLLVFMCLQNR